MGGRASSRGKPGKKTGEPPGTRTEPGPFRDAYCDRRCSCPARLFSLDLLNVPPGVRLRRPRFRAAPANFGLTCLATASLNDPGYALALKGRCSTN